MSPYFYHHVTESHASARLQPIDMDRLMRKISLAIFLIVNLRVFPTLKHFKAVRLFMKGVII